MTMTARTTGKPPTTTSASVTYMLSVSILLSSVDEREETYSRIKSTPRNPEKRPHIHHQTEPKRQRNIQQVTRRRQPPSVGGPSVGHLRPSKSKEQEKKSANKLAYRKHEVRAHGMRHVGKGGRDASWRSNCGCCAGLMRMGMGKGIFGWSHW